MTDDAIIGMVYEGRTIDRISELDNGLIDMGFTNNTFETMHRKDFDELVKKLLTKESEAPVETDGGDEIIDENVLLSEEGVVRPEGFISSIRNIFNNNNSNN